MPDETTEPEEKEELKIRDLTPKEDAKGGGSDAKKDKKDEKPPPRRTGEIDFMKGVS